MHKITFYTFVMLNIFVGLSYSSELGPNDDIPNIHIFGDVDDSNSTSNITDASLEEVSIGCPDFLSGRFRSLSPAPATALDVAEALKEVSGLNLFGKLFTNSTNEEERTRRASTVTNSSEVDARGGTGVEIGGTGTDFQQTMPECRAEIEMCDEDLSQEVKDCIINRIGAHVSSDVACVEGLENSVQLAAQIPDQNELAVFCLTHTDTDPEIIELSEGKCGSPSSSKVLLFEKIGECPDQGNTDGSTGEEGNAGLKQMPNWLFILLTSLTMTLLMQEG